jgi:hypothetical protein
MEILGQISVEIDNLTANEPIQRIFEGAWNSSRIFWARNEKPIRPRNVVAKVPHDLRDHVLKFVIEIRIEMRQSPDMRRNFDSDILRSQQRGGSQKRAVRRLRPQTSRHRQNVHRLQAEIMISRTRIMFFEPDVEARP